MKETFYFPHDMDAHSDPKIMELLGVAGLAGLGFYWIIIEILHQQKDGKITESAFKQYLNFYFKLENRGSELLTRVEQVLNTSKLLLKDVEGNIYSDRVLSNKTYRDQISAKRSFAGKKSAEARQNSTHVEQYKGKERKGNEIKRNISSSLRSEDSGEKISPTPKQTAQDFFEMIEKKEIRYHDFCKKIYETKKIPPAIISVELEKFKNHWREKNLSGKKERWEMEKTFEVQKRLATWFSNVEKFSKSQGYSRPIGSRIIS